jgi:hypothetical protein
MSSLTISLDGTDPLCLYQLGRVFADRCARLFAALWGGAVSWRVQGAAAVVWGGRSLDLELASLPGVKAYAAAEWLRFPEPEEHEPLVVAIHDFDLEHPDEVPEPAVVEAVPGVRYTLRSIESLRWMRRPGPMKGTRACAYTPQRRLAAVVGDAAALNRALRSNPGIEAVRAPVTMARAPLCEVERLVLTA